MTVTDRKIKNRIGESNIRLRGASKESR